ncbi:hypothetical protein LguiA_032302 [Lonicera macranthoides]
MDAAKNLLSPFSTFPPRTQLKHSPYSSSALVLHDQAAPAINSRRTTSLGQHFPTPVLIQEQRDESKLLLHITKEDTTSQATLDMRWMETGDRNETLDSDEYLEEFQRQLLHWPGLWYLLPSLKTENTPSLSLPDVSSDHKSYGANLDKSPTPRHLGSTSLAGLPVGTEKIVRSTRLLDRQSKKRGVPKQEVVVQESSSSKRVNLQKNKGKVFDTDDPLRLFLSIPETKQILTLKEESELIVHIQDLLRLEEVKSKLQVQFGREPALVEWADAIGLSCRALKSRLRCGNSSREKLIYATFRMVVYVAKQYQGRGLSLQDLLQEGSMGLIRSVPKFKPQASGRFANYAYWWIKQAVRMAIFRHSRIIRLPASVYGQLYKVKEAKRLCIQDGNHYPTNRDIAICAGITVEKLEELYILTRRPLSMQQGVQADQNTSFQDDTIVDTPSESVDKQLMKRHIRGLLNTLSPKERKVMLLRYGIEGGEQKSLSEIGVIFGSSRERIHQLESRALYKLKKCLGSHGLGAYSDLLF